MHLDEEYKAMKIVARGNMKRKVKHMCQTCNKVLLDAYIDSSLRLVMQACNLQGEMHKHLSAGHIITIQEYNEQAAPLIPKKMPFKPQPNPNLALQMAMRGG